jgi:uncharacterized protein with PIN domain
MSKSGELIYGFWTVRKNLSDCNRCPGCNAVVVEVPKEGHPKIKIGFLKLEGERE